MHMDRVFWYTDVNRHMKAHLQIVNTNMHPDSEEKCGHMINIILEYGYVTMICMRIKYNLKSWTVEDTKPSIIKWHRILLKYTITLGYYEYNIHANYFAFPFIITKRKSFSNYKFFSWKDHSLDILGYTSSCLWTPRTQVFLLTIKNINNCRKKRNIRCTRSWGASLATSAGWSAPTLGMHAPLQFICFCRLS